MRLHLDNWETKTNRLLKFAIQHCQSGDKLCTWYLWHSTGDQVFLRLWWKFKVDQDENYFGGFNAIEEKRRARMNQLRECFEPDFMWERSQLRNCLTCADISLS